MKFRVTFDAERADETAGSIRMKTTDSTAAVERDDFMV
jgi:hypothetical protein